MAANRPAGSPNTPREFDIVSLRASLLSWYDRERRTLPWREHPSVYGTWISEIMLQQTTVAAVEPRWLAFMARFPDVRALAAADEAELFHMVATACQIDDRPSAIRYPRGEATSLVEMPTRGTPLEIGKGRIVREGSKIAILSYGTRLHDALAAAEDLAARGLSTTVADARFAKPIDEDLVRRLAREHEVMITLEEGAIGGFAAQVMQFLALNGLLDNGLKFRPMTLPDFFIDHDKPATQIALANLDAKGVVATALQALGEATVESPVRA